MDDSVISDQSIVNSGQALPVSDQSMQPDDLGWGGDVQQAVNSGQQIASSFQLPVDSDQRVVSGGLQSDDQLVDQVMPTNAFIAQSDPSTPPHQPSGGWHKEAEPAVNLDRVPMVEVGKDHEFEPEVESWLEKIEKAEDVKLDQPVVQGDQVLVANADPEVDEELVVLPLTYDEVEQGLHMKVYDSARWLAEWCVRVVKLMGNKVRYREG